MSLIDNLLNLATSARVRLWLRLRYPGWYITEEIAENMKVLSKQRIQQILQEDFDKGLVERRQRKTNKPGPSPFEYSIIPRFYIDFSDEQIKKIKKIE
jgi:predicted transcriptional regulator